MTDYDEVILSAVRDLTPCRLLAWAILDQKPERFMCQALIAQINDTLKRRFAYAEHDRIDIVFKEDDEVVAGYEMKSAYLSDFREVTATSTFYHGAGMANDLQKPNWKDIPHQRLGFLIAEVNPPSAIMKYAQKENRYSVNEAFQRVEDLAQRPTVAPPVSSGTAQVGGADVRIHLQLFK